MSKFMMGKLVATPAALDLLVKHNMTPDRFVQRHMSGDWGDVDAEDAAANEAAVDDGGRLLSAFVIGEDRLWIITEAVNDWGERLSTTLLLPTDY